MKMKLLGMMGVASCGLQIADAVPPQAAALASDTAAGTPLAAAQRITNSASPRLYVIDCGQLVYNRPESYGLSREEVADTNMAVSCFLITHPKGNLLFDTGISDKLVGQPFYKNAVFGYGQVKTTTLRSKLAEIGVTPEQITYLALSHMHWDHVGNANEFAASTWLTQRAEYEAMFAKTPSEGYENYAQLRDAKKVMFDGDHDVFGDGTVVLKATPGHTPGHQSLYLKLAKTGGVLLSGDMYHYSEEAMTGQMPPEELKGKTGASRKAMASFLAQTQSQLWIPHSIAFARKARLSPAWYD